MKIVTTSIKENKIFDVTEIEAGNMPESHENSIVNVFDEIKYQEILGFGGAFTEAAAYNYAQMSEENKALVRRAYFDPVEGIGYNFGRTHINSCDFSLAPYTYVTEGDKTLESFDLGQDKKFVLPFLKDALGTVRDELVLFASPWSPPAYMKDTGNVMEGGKLSEEYKTTWAHYYAKYIKAMAAEGVTVSAITIQNEPMAIQPWESCQYSAEDEAEFAEKFLIPALDEEGLSHIKILVWDHNKERVYDRAKKVLRSDLLRERIWGVGHHWYSGEHFEGLKLVYEVLGKQVVCSEFCCGIYTDPLKCAELYAKEICEDLNNYSTAICDWNLILSEIGGPFHNRSYRANSAAMDPDDGCAAPILYNAAKDEVTITPCYYYIGHFSKYVKRGARRIATTKYTADLHVSAFENPDGEKVLVAMNDTDRDREIVVRHNDVCTRTILGAHSIATILW